LANLESSISSKAPDILDNVTKNRYRLSYHGVVLAQTYISQYIELLNLEKNEIYAKYALREEINTLIDSFKYESPKYGFIIKYRQENDNKKELLTCRGYVDSLTKKVYIKPNGFEIDDKELSKQFKELWNMNKKAVVFLENRVARIGLRKELLEKLEEL
jgi:hypothetical protein